MKYIREIFDDGLTRAAGIVFLLILAVTLISIYSNVAEQNPLAGTFIYAMIPFLFIAGGVIFVLAILRS